MAGAYPDCPDCIECPNAEGPFYVDVIYPDSRWRFYAGGAHVKLWEGITVNAYSDLAEEGTPGRVCLGQHTIDDLSSALTDCDLIVYFWDNDTEELFAILRNRLTGVDVTDGELWRVSCTSFPGVPYKSNNGYVCFSENYQAGLNLDWYSQVHFRNVATGNLETTIDDIIHEVNWATALDAERASVVVNPYFATSGEIEGVCAFLEDGSQPDTSGNYYAHNFVMGDSIARFSGRTSSTEGIYKNSPGNFRTGGSSTYTLEKATYGPGFNSQWCGKFYWIPSGGPGRWDYNPSNDPQYLSANPFWGVGDSELSQDINQPLRSYLSELMGRDLVFRAAYVVADTFPDGGDETADPCDCDGGNGGSGCSGCDCGEDATFNVTWEDIGGGCYDVTVSCGSTGPCGDISSFSWRNPDGDCTFEEATPPIWHDGTCGTSFESCYRYVIIRFIDSCGCAAEVCIDLETLPNDCECCADLPPTTLSVTISGVAQAESCEECPDVDGSYQLDVTDGGDCTWDAATAEDFLIGDTWCTVEQDLLLHIVGVMTIEDCPDGVDGFVTVVSEITFSMFTGSPPASIGGSTAIYRKETLVEIENIPFACNSAASGTHDLDNTPGSACDWPATISATWSYA